MVTTLMRYHPNTSQDTALNIPVNWPRQERERLRERLDVIASNVVQEKGNGKVIKDIGEGADNRALKAMRWDGFLDLAETEWRF